MESIRFIKFYPRTTGGIDQGRVYVNKGVPNGGGAIGTGEGIVVVDLGPAKHAIRRACATDKNEVRRRMHLADADRERVKASKDGGGILGGVARFQIVAATVINNNFRLIR